MTVSFSGRKLFSDLNFSLKNTGYRFAYPHLEQALQHLLNPPTGHRVSLARIGIDESQITSPTPSGWCPNLLLVSIIVAITMAEPYINGDGVSLGAEVRQFSDNRSADCQTECGDMGLPEDILIIHKTIDMKPFFDPRYTLLNFTGSEFSCGADNTSQFLFWVNHRSGCIIGQQKQDQRLMIGLWPRENVVGASCLDHSGWGLAGVFDFERQISELRRSPYRAPFLLMVKFYRQISPQLSFGGVFRSLDKCFSRSPEFISEQGEGGCNEKKSEGRKSYPGFRVSAQPSPPFLRTRKGVRNHFALHSNAA